MKKLIAVVVSIGLLIAGGLVWADSYTTNYNLTKPSRGSANWDTKINTNMDIIDSAIMGVVGSVGAEYGELAARLGSLPEIYVMTGIFNGPTGTTLTLPKSVDAVTEYAVAVEPTTRGGTIGDLYVTQGHDNATIHCAETNTSDTFKAIIMYRDDTNTYGSAIHRKWYVSPQASITDHCDNTTAGSLAWVAEQIEGYATIELPGNHEYAVLSSCSIPSAVHVVAQAGAKFSVASGQTLTIEGPFSFPDQQVFEGDGAVSLPNAPELRPEWWTNNTTPGTTDMAPAINKAIAAMGDRAALVFGSGVYALRSVSKCEDLPACGDDDYLQNYFIGLTDNLTIRGAGWSTVLKVGDGIYNQSDDDTSNAHVFQGFDVDNLVIRDLQIDMNGYNNLSPSGKTRNSIAVRLEDGGSNVLIDRVYILNNPGHNNVVANNTASATKATGLTVTNCAMYGGGTGVLGNIYNVDFSFIYSEWEHTIVNNNRLEQPEPTHTWSGGIELHASDSLASNNVITYCDPAVWIASAQQTGAVDIVRLGVAGNVMKDCATGVRFWSSGEIRDVDISNNVMSIMWRGGADKYIYGVQMVGRSSGNWLDSNAAGAPLFDVNIVNNVITGEDNDTRYGEGFGVPAGIAATSVHGLTVKGNTFHNLMGDGVLISGSPYGLSDLVIQGNYFKNWGRGHSGYGTAGVHVDISGGPAASWDETETVPDAGEFKLRTMVVENNVFEKEDNSTNWLDQVVTAYPYVIAGDDQYTAGQVYDIIIRNNVDHLANDTTSSDRVGGNLGLMHGHPWGVFYHNPTDFTAITAPDSSDPLYNAGYSPRGRVAWNRHPGVVAVGQPIGWVCTVAGDPGTWVPFGHIHPDPFAHGGTYAERPTTATMVAGLMSSFVCTDCDDCGAGPTPIWYAWWEDKWRCFDGTEVSEP